MRDWMSFGRGDRDSDGEEGVEAAWMAEIERRIVELDAGVAKTIPWDVVRDGLRQRLGG
jgi:putative addiction module component (TIGR02574 family)